MYVYVDTKEKDYDEGYIGKNRNYGIEEFIWCASDSENQRSRSSEAFKKSIRCRRDFL